MNKKISKKWKALVAAMLILMILTPNVAFGFASIKSELPFTSLTERYQNIKDYKYFLQEMTSFTQGLNTNISVDQAKILILDKLTELENKYGNSISISSLTNKIKNVTINSSSTSATDLISKVTDTVKELLGNTNLAVESLTPDEVVEIQSSTAAEVFGQEYEVKLSANVYYADVDKSGKPTSDKWALLIQGFQMTGQAMADAVGQMYIDQNINVLSIDIRGFGNSEGSEGMGYLESLDAWDWLTWLNKTYSNKCNEIIVHGISLGGATTLFLSGLEIDGRKIEDQNVIGLVEDCGYTSMEGIIQDLLGTISNVELVAKILGIFDKDSLVDVVGEEKIEELLIEKVDTGFSTVEDLRAHQNALDSLAKCKVPLLIIHGTEDMIVPFKNSDDVYDVAMNNNDIPYVQRFIAEGENHAFIVMGTQYNVYEGHIDNFIQKAEEIANGQSVDKESEYEQEEEEKTSVITSLIKALKLIKNIF